MAFFCTLLFGPVAGVLITHLNLKRLGMTGRSRTILWGGVLGAALFTIACVRAVPPSYFTYMLTISWGYYLYAVQEPACRQWKSEYPDYSYRSGWSVVGWGVLGAVIIFGMFFYFGLAFRP